MTALPGGKLAGAVVGKGRVMVTEMPGSWEE